MRVRQGAPVLVGYGNQGPRAREHSDPEGARRRVLAALEQTGGRVLLAAHVLGICRRHLYNCIIVLDLWADLERIREADAQRRERERAAAAAAVRGIVPDGDSAPEVDRGRTELRPRPCWWGQRKRA